MPTASELGTWVRVSFFPPSIPTWHQLCVCVRTCVCVCVFSRFSLFSWLKGREEKREGIRKGACLAPLWGNRGTLCVETEARIIGLRRFLPMEDAGGAECSLSSWAVFWVLLETLLQLFMNLLLTFSFTWVTVALADAHSPALAQNSLAPASCWGRVSPPGGALGQGLRQPQAGSPSSWSTGALKCSWPQKSVKLRCPRPCLSVPLLASHLRLSSLSQALCHVLCSPQHSLRWGKNP